MIGPAILEGLAAAAASGALALRLPLPQGDPLRPVLVALPLIVAAFRVLERVGRKAGAEDLPARAVRLEGFGVVGLFLFGVVRPTLGVGPEVPAAGLALLLLVHSALLCRAWRPLLAGGGPGARSRIPVVFLLLPLLVHLSVLLWTHGQRSPDGDGPWYLLVTQSLVEDGDVDLADEYRDGASRLFLDRDLEPQPGDPRGEDGQVWSRHGPFLPSLLVVPWVLGGVAGVRIFFVLLAALLAWRTLALLDRAFPSRAPGPAAGDRSAVLAAWWLFAFGPPLLYFSGQIWVEVPAALFLVVALEAVDSPSRRGRLVLLACLVALPLLKLRLAPIALGLALVAARRRAENRRVVGAFVLSLALLLLVQYLWLGSALGLHAPGELLEPARGPLRALSGLVGLFLDSSFGLLPGAPLWALWLVGLVAAARSRRDLLVDLGLVGGPYLLLVAPRLEWFGGWSPPFRYAIVLLPMLALLLAAGLQEVRSRGRWLVTFLGLPTLLLAALWMAVPGWVWNFADGRSHLLDYASLTLRSDLARFFPSTIRPRPATWWWLAAWLALPLVARWPRAGRRDPARQATVGLGLLLALVSTLALAAVRVPTKVVEAEDPWVRHVGGALAPERWWPHRVLYPGAWMLRSGTKVAAPVRPGGEEVEIRLVVAPIDRPLPLRVLDGDRELSARVVDGEGWREIELGRFRFDPETPLVVEVPPPEGPGVAGERARKPGSGILVDRIELRWRDP